MSTWASCVYIWAKCHWEQLVVRFREFRICDHDENYSYTIQTVIQVMMSVKLSGMMLKIQTNRCTIGFCGYDFLLVIDSIRRCILHRFRDIAFDIPYIGLCLAVAFNPRRIGFPLTISVKFSTKVIYGYMLHENGVETLSKIPTGWVRYTNVTDRRRQTE